MQKLVEKHGRDHQPPKYGDTTGGGNDPTRGMLFLPSSTETDAQVLTRDSTATYGIKWADAGGVSPVYMPGSQMFTGLQLFAAHTANDGIQVVQSSAVLHGGYASIYTTFDPDEPSINTPLMILPVWLGKADGTFGPPKGATDGGYTGHYLVRKGPDCCSMNLQIASAVVGGVVIDPYSVSWVDIRDDDLYAASSSWGDPWTTTSANYRTFLIKLTGADGDVATTYNSGGSLALDGGPGLYYFGFRRTGKNASSSDYLLDIAEFGVSGLSF